MLGDLLDAPTRPGETEVALAELAGIAHGHQLDDLERRCRTALRQARQGEFTVTVLGQFKAGKSSLLNCLLGSEVLPVRAIPATAVVTRVRAGDRLLARVRQHGCEPAEIPLDQLGGWVSQSGNPDNRRGVDWVEVQSPALADLAGLTLVDTPGTGSSWEANTRTSLDWLPNTGAALLAISATQPLAEPDLRLIDLLRPHTPSLTVLLTKIDLLSPADAAEVLSHVRHQLAARLPDPPAVQAFSTRPGYEALREQLRRHLRNLGQDRAAALEVLTRHRLTGIARDAAGYLDLAHAAATGHDRAVADLRRMLIEERARLATVRAQAQAQLRPVVQRLQARADKLLAAELPGLLGRVAADLEPAMPGWRGSLASETRAFRSWLADELGLCLTPLVARTAADLAPLLEEGLEPIRQLGQAYVQRLQDRVRSALGVEVRLPVPEPVAVDFRTPEAHLDAVFDSHLELLSWAAPMVLLRPLVHRHFRRTVGWQVEKNLYRAGYVTAARAAESLRGSLDAYLEVLAGEVDSYLRLAGEPSDVPRLEQELALVRGLASTTVRTEDRS